MNVVQQLSILYIYRNFLYNPERHFSEQFTDISAVLRKRAFNFDEFQKNTVSLIDTEQSKVDGKIYFYL